MTLTNYALYFETGVGLYDKAVRYDLAMDMKQVIKPELTGPLGARLFDKAVMYKSTSMYVIRMHNAFIYINHELTLNSRFFFLVLLIILLQRGACLFGVSSI